MSSSIDMLVESDGFTLDDWHMKAKLFMDSAREDDIYISVYRGTCTWPSFYLSGTLESGHEIGSIDQKYWATPECPDSDDAEYHITNFRSEGTITYERGYNVLTITFDNVHFYNEAPEALPYPNIASVTINGTYTTAVARVGCD